MYVKRIVPVSIYNSGNRKKWGMKKLDSSNIGAAYVRVSTNDQTELSPYAQIREIKKAAMADGILIPQELIFIEEKGVSGRRADNRREFQKMISVAKSQPCPFQYLYLWKFSRFARNQEESTFYKSILRKKCGVTIKSVSEPIMEGMFGRLIESIIEWFDEYYSINLSGEVTRGMTEKALRGGYQASPCLGYDAAGGGSPFLINEEEYKAVEFIHRSFHDGMSPYVIAKKANEMGFFTKRGNLFDRRAVEHILKNPFYKGVVTWKDISFKGTHETRKTVTSVFDENQLRFRQEYHPRKRKAAESCKHWASGLLRCGYCGASLGYSKPSKDGKKSGCFQCWRYAKGLHPSSCSISVHKAESLILESLNQMFSYETALYKQSQSSGGKKEIQSRQLEKALSLNRKKYERIKRAYENGIDTLEEYKKNKEELTKEQLDLQARLKEPSNPKDNSLTQKIPQFLLSSDFLSDPAIKDPQKAAALRSIIKKIEYDKEENKLKFYYYLAPQSGPPY